MGLLFRRSNYMKRVGLGKRTVKYGEAMAVWDRYGNHRQVIGPALVYLFSSMIQFLDEVVATRTQYLHVTHIDGREEMITGPVTMYSNPVLHRQIRVVDGLALESANHIIVVNRPIKVDAPHHGSSIQKHSSQEIVCGPIVYFPESLDEFVHTFKWGSDEPFTTLNIVSTMYEIPEIHLKFPHSGYRVLLRLMYRVTDVKKLVANCSDLHLEFVATVSKDVYGIECDFNQILNLKDESDTSANGLSPLVAFGNVENYPNLLTRCDVIGVKIEAIQVKQIHADEKTMQEYREAQARKLKKDQQYEEQKQKQSLQDLELTGNRNREKDVQAFEEAKLNARLRAEAMTREQTDKASIAYLEQLKQKGVDLDKYLEIVGKTYIAYLNPKTERAIKSLPLTGALRFDPFQGQLEAELYDD